MTSTTKATFFKWLAAVLPVAFISSCITPRMMTEAEAPSNIASIKPSEKVEEIFNQRVEVTIPIALAEGEAELNADVFRPLKKTVPKTLIILVPGSGNVSRRGEISGDGVRSYKEARNMYVEWAQALAEAGYFVLSYDKRTCSQKINPICLSNDQKDIDRDGVFALARDVDQVYSYAKSKLASEENARIVLMSTTQGAQAVAFSNASQTASGVVFLSPIVSDLEASWVSGLAKAAEKTASLNEKNQLLNRKESMGAFFTSLNRGDFPETAHVKGASIMFWQNWINASKNTLTRLAASARPVLLMFSRSDSFTTPELITAVEQQAKKKPTLRLGFFNDTDRNFTLETGVPKAALKEVKTFIDGLPLLSM